MNRERIQAVRDRIAAEPPERLEMSTYLVFGPNAELYGEWTKGRLLTSDVLHNCGTAACIAGWALAVAHQPVKTQVGSQAGLWLGLSADQAEELFEPTGFSSGVLDQADALAALDSLINAEDDNALPVWPDKAEAA